MHLVDNWRRILRKAWSVRIMLFAALLDGAAAGWFVFADTFPPPAFFGVSCGLSVAAVVARLISQPEVHS